MYIIMAREMHEISFINFIIYRVTLNIISASIITFGVLFDVGVWYYVKDLKIFDDDDEQKISSSSATNQNIQMDDLNSMSSQLKSKLEVDQTRVSS